MRHTGQLQLNKILFHLRKKRQNFASFSLTHKTVRIAHPCLTQTVTLPGWISGVDQIKQKVTTSLAEAFHTRGENGLTATCPAGYVSTVPRNQLIQQWPVNKKLRQRGKKLVAMGFGCLWMLLRESICHSSEELIFAEVLTGRTYCAKQQQQQLQKNPLPPQQSVISL